MGSAASLQDFQLVGRFSNDLTLDFMIAVCCICLQLMAIFLDVFHQELMGNHLEERLLDQVQARASHTPPFWGVIRVAYPKA